MKKLNNRQIIILAVAALCVFYAIYELVVVGAVGKRTETGAKPPVRESFVATLNSDLMKYVIAKTDTYIIERAEMNWNRNPFWDRSAYREYVGKESSVDLAAKIVYSGYVDAGRKKLAIINGWEYEAGDALDIKGYILKGVTPSRALIFNRNTGSEFYVPIQE
jgi:hypothetical protein